jgi:hypothetical protein
MIKKDGTQQISKASANEAFKCGDCLHFKQTPHRSNAQVCSKEGIRQFALAPKCYTPDYTKVITNTDEFVAISTFFSSRTPQQRKILMGMLRQQPQGKKLKLGTKMYLNLRARDYVSNYVSGYVVGYTSGGDIVLSGSPSEKTRGRVFFAYLRTEKSLITAKEWKTKYVDLVTRGRIQDPDVTFKRDITAKVEKDEYEVPTIDNAPKEKGKKVEKINKRTTPLTRVMEF